MDKAIGFVTEIRNQDPTRPFFLYVANNAVHGPLQAKEADLAKYHGRYDAGWDVVRARASSARRRWDWSRRGPSLPNAIPPCPPGAMFPPTRALSFCVTSQPM